MPMPRQHVSLLQQIMQYLQLAGTVAQFVPEKHVQVIGGVLRILSQDLQTVEETPEVDLVHQIVSPAPAPAEAPKQEPASTTVS